MATAMGGIDALTFTGGVGENSAPIRAATCAAIAFLGVEIDKSANDAGRHDRIISSLKSTVAVMVLGAREDIELATQVRLCLAAGP
jgi:acetate kinase